MYTTETHVRVRYGETDKMGFSYYGNYTLYFEVGRTEMLRTLGFTYKQWEDSGILLPVRSLSISYHAPAYYDDLLLVRTTLKGIPSSRIIFDYEVFNEAGDLICTGNTVLVFVDEQTRRPTRPPDEFLQKIKEKGNF